MKVILLQNVNKVGRKGEVVEVSDGYASNALFPVKKAIPATPNNLEALKRKIDSDKATKDLEHELLERAIKSLPEDGLVLKMKANEKGHLFSKVNEDLIVEALANYRIVVSPKNIVLDDQIKELGSYSIKIEEGSYSKNIPLVITKE